MGRRLVAAGLVTGTQGNVSARDEETGLIAISPSGMEYDLIEADDVPVVDLRGHPVEGHRRPSTELPTHLAIYRRRPEVGAIIHTHSLYATVLAVLGWSLPPILGEAAAVLGGEVRVAPYATTGTELLGRYAAEALAGRQAVLLKNHGALAVGPDLREALHVALVLESTARIYWAARLAGPVVELPPDEVARIRQGYLMHYGQRPRAARTAAEAGPQPGVERGSAGSGGSSPSTGQGALDPAGSVPDAGPAVGQQGA